MRCDLNCERCEKVLELINKHFKEHIGIYLTTIDCPLELEEILQELELSRVENKIWLEYAKKSLRKWGMGNEI